MALKEQLLSDLKAAMKEKDDVRKSTVTMVRAAILQVEKDTKQILDDSAILDVIAKQVKMRKDALVEFTKGARDDLVEATKKELDVLFSYLPKQLSYEEVKAVVEEAVREVGAQTMKDMGKIMANVNAKIKGQTDSKTISQAAKELLQK